MQVDVRPIKKQDYEAVSDMMHELWRIHAAKSRHINGTYLEKHDARKELRKKGKIILVAEANCRAVGYAYLSIEKAEDYFNFKKYLYLDEILVSEGYRGRGVGRKLLEEVKRVSRRRGLPLLLRIWPFSKQMLNLSSEEGDELLYSTFIFPQEPYRTNRCS